MFTKLASHCKTILKYSVIYAGVTHCTFEYIGDFVVCNGPSMEPTLHTNNILVTERMSCHWKSQLCKRQPQRGDIIIAVSPVDPKQHICKRVVGVPGDKIVTTNALDMLSHVDDVYADDDEMEAAESKTNTVEKPQFHEELVPRGHVWIEGDNSENSSDSREYGPIPVGLIRARAVYRIWPLQDFQKL